MLRDQKGEGRLGCLVTLLLVVVFGFVCTKTIPVYLDKLEFEEGMARIASKAGVENWSPEEVRTRVLALARAKEFVVSKRDVRVQRPVRFMPVPEIKIDVAFRRPVEFPGYVHTFQFNIRVSSFVGRL